MPRLTKKSVCVVKTSVCQENSIVSQEYSSSYVEMEVQSPQFIQPSTGESQLFEQPRFMPYIEGPKMDWTVNDSLYHRFLKWKLKCENIWDCELAMFPDSKKCMKVRACSGDFGMDQYVSWCLLPEDLRLDVIWAKFEDFCKPQTNEASGRFDLLTNFIQGNCSIDEWYNALQTQVSFAKYPPETASILHRDIFCFFEEWGVCFQDHQWLQHWFRQVSYKQGEAASKSTARHIKAVASDPQATKVNLMRHQRTHLPPSQNQVKTKFPQL